MIISHQLNAFLHKNQEYRLDAVRGDTGRGIALRLHGPQADWSVPQGTKAWLRFRKSDNTGGVYDTLPDGTSAWSFCDNVLSVALAPQVLSVAGEVELQVVLVCGTEELSTFTIYIDVQEDPTAGVIVSEDYVNLSSWFAQQAQEQARVAELENRKLLGACVDVAYELGALSEGGGLEEDSEYSIRSGKIYHGGQKICISFPAGLVVSCSVYHANGRRAWAFFNRTVPFSVEAVGAYARVSVAYENGSPVTDVQTLADKVAISFAAGEHYSYRGNAVLLGLTSVAACTQEGYYSFTAEDVDVLSDAPAVTSGGVIIVKLLPEDGGVQQTIRSFDGRVWVRNGSDFAELAHADKIPLCFQLYQQEDGAYVAHVSLDQIQTAEEKGQLVLCNWDNQFLPLVMVSDGVAYFSAVLNGELVTVRVDDQDVQIARQEIVEDHYASFAEAVADINAGVRTGRLVAGTGACKVVTSHQGKPTVVLLRNVNVPATVTVSASMDIAMNGRSLTLMDPNAELIFGQGARCTIWASQPNSNFYKCVIASEACCMLRANCDDLRIVGGYFHMSGLFDQAPTVISVGEGCRFRMEGAKVECLDTSGTAVYDAVLVNHESADGRIVSTEMICRTGVSNGICVQNSGELMLEDCVLSAESQSAQAVGIVNQPGAVVRIHGGKLFSDSVSIASMGLDNLGQACVTEGEAHGTLCGLRNQGRLYVSGGTFTGYSHGGIYFAHGAQGVAYVNDAHLRDGNYEGELMAENADNCLGGFCLGGSSDMRVYLDGCSIDGSNHGFALRGDSGETGNTAYLSNCTLAGNVLAHIHTGTDTNTVTIGLGGNITADRIDRTECASFSGALYRKVPAGQTLDGRDLAALVAYVSSIQDKGE